MGLPVFAGEQERLEQERQEVRNALRHFRSIGAVTHRHGYGWGWGNGWGWNGYGRGVGTAESTARHGHAAQMRGYGQMNRDNAVANMYNQEAYRQYLQNERERIRTYFDRQMLNRQGVEEQKQWVKRRQAMKKIENLEKMGMQELPHRSKLPNLLFNDQLDDLTGEITWPHLLRKVEFASHRHALEELFRFRAQGADVDEVHAQVRMIVSQMGNDWNFKAQLKKYLRKYKNGVSPQQYIESKRFLESLEFESGLRYSPRRAIPGRDKET